jgi:hypothetical protein
LYIGVNRQFYTFALLNVLNWARTVAEFIDPDFIPQSWIYEFGYWFFYAESDLGYGLRWWIGYIPIAANTTEREANANIGPLRKLSELSERGCK